jgi:hypothetical protein
MIRTNSVLIVGIPARRTLASSSGTSACGKPHWKTERSIFES